MRFGVITLFPEAVQASLVAGVVGRAVARQKVDVQYINPRDFSGNRHRRVDDRPFGGGPGMVMMAEPLVAAIGAARRCLPGAPVVYLTPQGRQLDQKMIEAWAQLQHLVLLCGRYEGVDQRVIDHDVDEEVSLGDFVLSGGEIAASAVIDAVSRLIPGVLGHPDSANEDSFAVDGLLDHPHYTRPESVEGREVPAVLLSGDHRAIARWRREQALKATWERRSDLLEKADLASDDNEFLQRLADTSGVAGSRRSE